MVEPMKNEAGSSEPKKMSVSEVMDQLASQVGMLEERVLFLPPVAEKAVFDSSNKIDSIVVRLGQLRDRIAPVIRALEQI